MNLYGLTGPQVKDLAQIKRKVLGFSGTSSAAGRDTDEGHGKASKHFQINTVTDPLKGVCLGTEVLVTDAGVVTAVPGGDTTAKLVVTGGPMKVGLVVFATHHFGVWAAEGYPHRVLDYGTGAQSPLVIESGVLKMKTITTADGITWTRETITVETTTC